jgi:hypothetical protein
MMLERLSGNIFSSLQLHTNNQTNVLQEVPSITFFRLGKSGRGQELLIRHIDIPPLVDKHKNEGVADGLSISYPPLRGHLGGGCLKVFLTISTEWSLVRFSTSGAIHGRRAYSFF